MTPPATLERDLGFRVRRRFSAPREIVFRAWTVTVRFSEIGNGTEVTLLQEHLPEIAVCLRHRAGWMAAWERLERLLQPAGRQPPQG